MKASLETRDPAGRLEAAGYGRPDASRYKKFAAGRAGREWHTR
jgi:hypothetical protein